MKKQIKTVNEIAAPTNQIWEHLRTGKGVNLWLPIITSCRVEGNKRFCTTEDSQLEETILESDDLNKVFKYSIEKQDLFPVTNIVGRMQLVPVNETTSKLHWDVEFNIEDETHFPQIKEGIEQVYAMGAKGLEELTNAVSLT